MTGTFSFYGAIDTNRGNDPNYIDGKSKVFCTEDTAGGDGSNDNRCPIDDGGVDTNDDDVGWNGDNNVGNNNDGADGDTNDDADGAVNRNNDEGGDNIESDNKDGKHDYYKVNNDCNNIYDNCYRMKLRIWRMD